MWLLILAYIGGVLTILSPCILPVLPFVFAKSDKPFLQTGLPLLLGMALTFAVVATLAALGGSWIIHANEYGRWIALVLLALVGLSLLSTTFSEWITAPLVSMGNRWNPNQESRLGSIGIGIATGLLWAPCAGPILGLLLAGAAIHGANIGTTLLLLSYALGASTSLGLAVWASGRVLKTMKQSLGFSEGVKKILGFLIVLGVVCIALGWDKGILTRLSTPTTTRLEERLLAAFHSPSSHQASTINGTLPSLDSLGPVPSLSGGTQWLNSKPLSSAQLKGKVVLVDFWTYSCINCLRTLPYLKGWAEKYKDHGLVVIGVHTPEFAFEKDPVNVEKAIHDLGITYPVVMDNNYFIWRAFANEFWPAHYLIDSQGMIRHEHFGEGEYKQSEDLIRELLQDSGQKNLPSGYVGNTQSGVQASPSQMEDRSPETYVGYQKAEHFVGRIRPDSPWMYPSAPSLDVNEWSLNGFWTVKADRAVLKQSPGTIAFNFQGRDLNMVLGNSDHQPLRFKVILDGKEPGDAHGQDCDRHGMGLIQGQRLYQLIRISNNSQMSDKPHFVQIEFIDSNVSVYAFTFG